MVFLAMRIMMMTNTYLPHVSGVAQSVARFVAAYREEGHEVLVAAPEYEEQPEHEEDVIRVPAIQHFNGSDFSVVIPIPLYLTKALNSFSPELIHSHHPFLLGDTALRAARARHVPLVFTHHTMYEQYTHYVPLGAPNLAKAVVQLSTGYANRCDRVIAPSAHVKRILRERGVTRPIDVIPTGVDTKQFAPAGGKSFRKAQGIPADAFVVGHVGRLAPEKNLDLLLAAATIFLREHEEAHLVITGGGPSETAMREKLRAGGVQERCHFTGRLSGENLVAAYSSFDVFVFTSKSETQGMVLVEAMAAGAPVAALNAPPVDEIVSDGKNGRLTADEDPSALAKALGWIREQPTERLRRMRAAARRTARDFDTRRCARQALDLYNELLAEKRSEGAFDEAEWHMLLDLISEEWEIWTNRIAAAATAISNEKT